MPSYLILTLDPTGRVLSAFDAICPGDKAAFAWAAATLVDNDGAEVWADGTCIARVDRKILEIERDLRKSAKPRRVIAVSFWQRERAGLGRLGLVEAGQGSASF